MSSIDAWDTGLRANFSSFLTWITIGRNAFSDEHWAPMVKNCNPCSVNYDLIGHLESLNEDLEVRTRSKVNFTLGKTMYTLDFIWRIKLENWSKRTRSWIEKCEWSFNDKLKLPVNRKMFEPSFVPSIIYSFFIGKGYRIYKKETFMADLTLEIRLKLLRLVWI